MFVAPSPKNATETRGSPRSLKASAAPVIAGSPPPDDRVRAEVPALDVVQVHRAAVAVRAALDLPVQLRHHLVRVRPARERVPVRAVRGGEDVPVLHRLADTDRDRLLADRDVQEPGQLTSTEALLDLLLEVPDQQHLLEELAQPLLGERAPLAFDLRHEPEFMLRAMRLATQWRRVQAELPAEWTEARLSFTVSNPQRLERATALLAPLQPGRAGPELHFVVARRGAGPSPAALDRALRRLVEARIGGELRARRRRRGALGRAPRARFGRGGLGNGARRPCPPTGAISTARSS